MPPIRYNDLEKKESDKLTRSISLECSTFSVASQDYFIVRLGTNLPEAKKIDIARKWFQQGRPGTAIVFVNHDLTDSDSAGNADIDYWVRNEAIQAFNFQFCQFDWPYRWSIG